MLLQGTICNEEESFLHDEECLESNIKLQASSKRRSFADSPVVQLQGPRQFDIIFPECSGSKHHPLGYGHNYHGAKTSWPN